MHVVNIKGAGKDTIETAENAITVDTSGCRCGHLQQCVHVTTIKDAGCM